MTNTDAIIALSGMVQSLARENNRMQEALEAIYHALDNSTGHGGLPPIFDKCLQKVQAKVFQKAEDA